MKILDTDIKHIHRSLFRTTNLNIESETSVEQARYLKLVRSHRIDKKLNLRANSINTILIYS